MFVVGRLRCAAALNCCNATALSATCQIRATPQWLDTKKSQAADHSPSPLGPSVNKRGGDAEFPGYPEYSAECFGEVAQAALRRDELSRFGSSQVMRPIAGRKAHSSNTSATLVMSASSPSTAAPTPPMPKARPKNNPATIPTLPGISSCA